MPSLAQIALKCALPAQSALPGALPFSFPSWNTDQTGISTGVTRNCSKFLPGITGSSNRYIYRCDKRLQQILARYHRIIKQVYLQVWPETAADPCQVSQDHQTGISTGVTRDYSRSSPGITGSSNRYFYRCDQKLQQILARYHRIIKQVYLQVWPETAADPLQVSQDHQTGISTGVTRNCSRFSPGITGSSNRYIYRCDQNLQQILARYHRIIKQVYLQVWPETAADSRQVSQDHQTGISTGVTRNCSRFLLGITGSSNRYLYLHGDSRLIELRKKSPVCAFLAGRDECQGSKCQSPTARVRVRVGCVNKNFNLGYNFLTNSDRALILQKCIPCDKTFHMVP